MDSKLYDSILDAIKDRKSWETRQQVFYRMRHNGIKRAAKPYPGAPDRHFPLIDTTIEKTKPFYVQQLYTGETLATFVSLSAQDGELTSSVSYWFDHQLKQNSNFEPEIISGFDIMLNGGRAPIKVYWDADAQRLAFDACNPLHVIVPKGVKEPNPDGDWLVHVMHFTRDQYEAEKNYKQVGDGIGADDFIKTISGRGTANDSGENAQQQDKDLREGLTYGKDDTIVVWEVFKRDRQGKKITVETISPVLPKGDNVLRAAFDLPYTKGVFKEGAFPFVFLRSEIKDKGYYSPRGLPELQAPFESSMNSLWNAQQTWLDFFMQPCFQQADSTNGPLPNPANVKYVPGGIIPHGLQAVQNPEPPAAIREEMNFTRAVAEYRANIPDLGANEHLSEVGPKKTATQVNAIVGMSGQSNDLRARVTKLDLGNLFNMSWAILTQYANKSLQFLRDNELSQLDAAALNGEYLITPNGSADSWNKGAEVQKAQGVYQQLQGSPFINQGELTKYLLEKIEPRLVKTLFQDPQIKQQDEAEQQNNELLLMMNRFAARVRESDDDKTHLQTTAQWFQVWVNEPNPDPITAGLVLQHIQGHGAALQQKKDPAFAQFNAMFKPISATLAQIAQSAPQPGNVIPGPGAQPQISNGGTVPPSANGKAPDPVGDGTKIMNALAALIKSGVPISHAEINQSLAQVGLPPLPDPQAAPQQATA